MWQAVGAALGHAVGIAISPSAIIAVILVLFSTKRVVNSLLFLAGWIVGIGVVFFVVATVADGARCSLASQHTLSVASLLELGRTSAQDHIGGRLGPAEPYVVAPIIDLIDGQAVLDPTFADKNPDWSYGGDDSASVPAELYADTPVAVRISEHAS